MPEFIETDCTITGPNGQTATAGGASLVNCSDGLVRGVVYAKANSDGWHRGQVTDWHGNVIAHATFSGVYRGGFGAKMRTVRFIVDGVTFSGRYGCDWSNAVKVKSVGRATLPTR